MPFPRVSCFYTSLNGDDLTIPPIIDPVGRSSILQALHNSPWGWGPTWDARSSPLQMERERSGAPEECQTAKCTAACTTNLLCSCCLPLANINRSSCLAGFKFFVDRR
ncbi:hypothetical protein GE21DRAFT_1308157 [Neurospora crassa]|nr:hypothetical protein B21J21.60 [imported] - Neurospora crassa [Neurospora crassa]KHE84895.1 hypothetical protein GE21DRAFT_1308157 [Neurospora crassa]